ncbi:MAG: nicotinate (nicotinamide) nucleotide adenylyltransferase [Flavobacteriales bacterium]
MKKIGLFFGSFNPIHNGHMILANYMLEFTNAEEIWFVISPQNPLKEKASLLSENDRYQLVLEAIENEPRFRASTIEFKFAQPSYTINTLVHLQEKYPAYDFSLIIGEDNLGTFHKWKNHERILELCDLLVYPRPHCEKTAFHTYEKVKLVDAPQVDISSSFIRKAIKDGKNVQYFVPERVWKYMMEWGFYK